MKDDLIRFRCTPEQRAKIAAGAKAVGMTLSGYILYKLGVEAGDAIGAAIVERIRSDDVTLRSHDF